MQSFCQWLGRRKPARPAIVFSPGYHHAAPGSAMDPSRAERVMAALRRVRAVRDRDVIEPQPIALEVPGLTVRPQVWIGHAGRVDLGERGGGERRALRPYRGAMFGWRAEN